MRAAFCTGPRQIELRDVPTPEPVPGEVLVRVHACGICGSDLHHYGAGLALPVCLGHEICGRVASATPGFALGDPVVVEPLLSCGACARCRAGEPNLCPSVRVLGSMAPGGMADAVRVPASCVYPVPAALDLDTAMLAEPLAVAVHGVGLAAIAPGDEVLVLGAGAIGLLTTFAAVRTGARVTVSARHPHQQRAARNLGAARVIATDREAIRAATAARPPNAVLETVGGTADTLDLALKAVRAGGRIVALGMFTRPITLDPMRFLMKEARLTSSMTYSRTGPHPDFVTALTHLARERAVLAPLITHRVPLAEVGRGFTLASDKSSGAVKVALTMEPQR